MDREVGNPRRWGWSMDGGFWELTMAGAIMPGQGARVLAMVVAKARGERGRRRSPSTVGSHRSSVAVEVWRDPTPGGGTVGGVGGEDEGGAARSGADAMLEAGKTWGRSRRRGSRVGGRQCTHMKPSCARYFHFFGNQNNLFLKLECAFGTRML